MKRKTVALVVVIVMLLAAVVPATAITGGEPDNGRHPYVGLAVFYVGGEPQWRCSGTLLSSTIFLTAGHCTEGAESAQVWFAEYTPLGDLVAKTGYPYTGGDAMGTPYTHPNFKWALPDTYDVGVIVLDTAITDKGYGELPSEGFLNGLEVKRGQKDLLFTVVGFGLKEIRPSYNSDRTRYLATSTLVNLRSALTDGYNIHTSNNPGQGQGRGQTSGGTCFGDSGGPVFYGDASSNLVIGITSFGLNQNCKGADFAFRTDVPGVADWIMAH